MRHPCKRSITLACSNGATKPFLPRWKCLHWKIQILQHFSATKHFVNFKTRNVCLSLIVVCRLGDQILSVNGTNLECITHTDAVQTLKNSGKDVELVNNHLSLLLPCYIQNTSLLSHFGFLSLSLSPNYPSSQSSWLCRTTQSQVCDVSQMMLWDKIEIGPAR